MSRFQLSLNVSDVESSVEFYSTLFGVGPAKLKPGYANFIVEDPPMKLVVIEDEGAPGSINHLGIELATSDEVAAETARVAAAGLPVEVDDPHTCCFATQDKAWTADTDGVPWELYTVTADTAGFGASPRGGTPVDTMMPPVDIEELAAALDDDRVVVIDAQGPGGYRAAHIPGAVDFDLDRVEEQAAEFIDDTSRQVVVYCTDLECRGAEFVGLQLVEAGYTNVRRYRAGVAGWTGAGRPTTSQG